MRAIQCRRRLSREVAPRLRSPAAQLAACHKAPPPPVYQAVPVERRDIVVTAQAAGAINPDTTVEVKSKASGEILDIKVSTGDLVKHGTLIVQVDQRIPPTTWPRRKAALQVDSASSSIRVAQLQPPEVDCSTPRR